MPAAVRDTDTVTMRLTQNAEARVKALADARGVTPFELLESLLDAELARLEARNRARRAGQPVDESPSVVLGELVGHTLRALAEQDEGTRRAQR
jgi:predicted transcriptional regulator